MKGSSSFFFLHKMPIYIRAVDHDSLLASLCTKSRCVKLQYENDLKVKYHAAEKRSGIPHRCCEITWSALYLGSHLSADLLLRFGQSFLGQFGSSVTVCDEGLQVLCSLRRRATISHYEQFAHIQFVCLLSFCTHTA